MKRVIKNWGSRRATGPSAPSSRRSRGQERACSTPRRTPQARIRLLRETDRQDLHELQRRAAPAGAIDFDDLLLLTARMLERQRRHPRPRCTERWRHLMIDEYQDTNHAQFRIASPLAGERPPERSAGVSASSTPPGRTSASWATPTSPSTAGAAPTSPTSSSSSPTTPARRSSRSARTSDPRAPSSGPPTRSSSTTPSARTNPSTPRPAAASPHDRAHEDERHEAELIADWFRALSEDSTGSTGATWPCSTAPTRSPACRGRDAPVHDPLPDRPRHRLLRPRGDQERDRLPPRRRQPQRHRLAPAHHQHPHRGIGKKTLDTIQGAASRAGIPLWEGLAPRQGARALGPRPRRRGPLRRHGPRVDRRGELHGRERPLVAHRARGTHHRGIRPRGPLRQAGQDRGRRRRRGTPRQPRPAHHLGARVRGRVRPRGRSRGLHRHAARRLGRARRGPAAARAGARLPRERGADRRRRRRGQRPRAPSRS